MRPNEYGEYYDAGSTIYIRDVSKEEARREIVKMLDTATVDLYCSTIQEILCLDYELIWEIIKELHEEGYIETGD
jgi:hypothetical protein